MTLRLSLIFSFGQLVVANQDFIEAPDIFHEGLHITDPLDY